MGVSQWKGSNTDLDISTVDSGEMVIIDLGCWVCFFEDTIGCQEQNPRYLVYMAVPAALWRSERKMLGQIM